MDGNRQMVTELVETARMRAKDKRKFLLTPTSSQQKQGKQLATTRWGDVEKHIHLQETAWGRELQLERTTCWWEKVEKQGSYQHKH